MLAKSVRLSSELLLSADTLFIISSKLPAASGSENPAASAPSIMEATVLVSIILAPCSAIISGEGAPIAGAVAMIPSAAAGIIIGSPPIAMYPMLFLTDSGKLGSPLLPAGIGFSPAAPPPANICRCITLLFIIRITPL